MRNPWFREADPTDTALGLCGVALALASIVFAWSMTASAVGDPRIAGMEHLAIYAQPKSAAPNRIDASPGAKVDYTPVGSIRRLPNALLSSYEIMDATRDAATIRLPEGRVTRASLGTSIAGLGRVIAIEQRGKRWLLVTESGVIRQR